MAEDYKRRDNECISLKVNLNFYLLGTLSSKPNLPKGLCFQNHVNQSFCFDFINALCFDLNSIRNSVVRVSFDNEFQILSAKCEKLLNP